MQAQMADKSSPEYQRMTWEALKKSVNGCVNKVTKANITLIIQELFKENLVRGRGLYCRSVMKAVLASPGFANVYAALTAVINTKLPENGETLLKRVVMQFRRSYKRNDKPVCVAMVKFIAHLINQQVAHEILGLQVPRHPHPSVSDWIAPSARRLKGKSCAASARSCCHRVCNRIPFRLMCGALCAQLLTVLLEKPTDDSVELAVNFVKESGAAMQQLSPQVSRFPGLVENLAHGYCFVAKEAVY